MKLILLQENLHTAISIVGKNITTKTQLPILSNILLVAKNGQLKLASTNLETSTSYWMGAKIEEEGAFTVPARFFAELVSSFTHDQVILIQEKNVLKITCGESEATLSGIDAAEYPPLPEVNSTKDMVLDKSLIGSGLDFVLISASTDESRPILTGVRFLEQDEKLLMVATDGFRLSIKELPKHPLVSNGFVLPAKALAEVFRLANGESAKDIGVSFSKDKNQVVFTLENAQIATRLLDGEYPSFQKIIPSGFTTRVVIEKSEFLQAVKFAAVYARESANIIKFTIAAGHLIISANSPQVGENKTKVAARVEGEGGEIAFNARFLLDMLGVFPAEEIAFEMSGALAPGVFKNPADPSYLHIIMPVRVQS